MPSEDYKWGTPGIVQDVRSWWRGDTPERRQAAHDIVENSHREWNEKYGNWSQCDECGEDVETPSHWW